MGDSKTSWRVARQLLFLLLVPFRNLFASALLERVREPEGLMRRSGPVGASCAALFGRPVHALLPLGRLCVCSMLAVQTGIAERTARAQRRAQLFFVLVMSRRLLFSRTFDHNAGSDAKSGRE